MANGWYTNGLTAFATAGVNWSSDTIKAALVNIGGGGYTVNLATDQYYSTISPYVVGTPQQITSPTYAGGVLSGANVTYTALSGLQVGAVVIYKDTGTGGTSPLLGYIDTGTILPVTPDGRNIILQWGASGILQL
jgi:hypothetical protein